MALAVFCDLSALDINFISFQKALLDVNKSVSFVKFYNYNNRKHRDFIEFIKEHQAEVSIQVEKRDKNRLDLRQAIDIIKYFLLNEKEKELFIISSIKDSAYLFKTLKSLDIKIYFATGTKIQTLNFVDKIIYLEKFVGEEFLPYSKIATKKDEMKEIKEKLNEILDKKIAATRTRLDSSEEIEGLLKKYF